MKRKKTNDVVPAILEKNFSKIEEKIKKVNNLTKNVQVDICDGKFVKSKTFASAGCEESFLRLRKISKNTNLELDVMVNLDMKIKGRFEKWLNSISKAKPARVIFHLDSTKRWDEVFDFFKKKENKNIKIGLGIKIQNKQKEINKLLQKYKFDYVQFMGIEKIGFGGQKISPKVYTKIKNFVKKYPQMYIQVDGGVKIENASKLKKAGVCSFAAGSGIYKSENIKKRISEFKKV
ncbi:hypothetical protein CSB11_02045 [Candidatus Campbellbacteria bacterium]|nr:MAG: hypothetical protein CSB11_02045 [Candidatus Campbellbacteria bacterium]